jgi:hypothetical protein
MLASYLSFSRSHLFAIGWLLLLLSLLLVVSYPLSHDGGSHIHNAQISSGLRLGDPVVSSLFAPRPGFVPNLTVPVLLQILLGVLTPLWAGKCFAAALFLTLFLSLCYLSASFSPSQNLGLLALCLSNCWFYWMGFWGFTLASAFAFFALGWLWRQIPNWKPIHTVPLALFFVLILITHPLPASFFLAMLCLVSADAYRRKVLAPAGRNSLVLLILTLTGLMGFILSSLGTKNAHGPSLFVNSTQQLAEAVLFFPNDAFEVIRLPHADSRYILACQALFILLALRSAWIARSGWKSEHAIVLLVAAGGLLLGRLLLNDAQAGGAFLISRLGFYAWTLLCIWAWTRPEQPAWRPWLHAALAVSLLLCLPSFFWAIRNYSSAISVMEQTFQAARLRSGDTFVRATLPNSMPPSERRFDRYRLLTLLPHSVDWIAASNHAFHLSNYELLGGPFLNTLRGSSPELLPHLLALDEPSPPALHLQPVLLALKPRFCVLIGLPTVEDNALLAQIGYQPVSRDPMLTIYARP